VLIIVDFIDLENSVFIYVGVAALLHGATGTKLSEDVTATNRNR
jgi:hypothetical protein